jgi:hypothetical protein
MRFSGNSKSRGMKKLFLFLLFAVMPLACKENVSDQTEEAVAVEEIAVANADAAPAAIRMMKLPPPEPGSGSGNGTIQPKIIKSASLRFETPDLDATYNQITSAVKKHGAQIQSDTEGKDDESIFRTIAVRIPHQHFDAFLADAGKGISYFDRKEISSQDVTEEYIDVDARLKTKKVLEARYLELLKKAAKVSEILEIEKELASVREEIESKEGQLKYLENHVSMSTVDIEFYKKTAVEGGITVSYGSKMANALKSGFNGISAFFIGLLYIWPFILILVALFFFIRRKIKGKKIL